STTSNGSKRSRHLSRAGKMASRAQIARLAQRIEALAPSTSRSRVTVIWSRVGETEEEATERHYRQRPKDRGAPYVIQVVFVAAKNGRPVDASSESSHEVITDGEQISLNVYTSGAVAASSSSAALPYDSWCCSRSGLRLRC